MQQEDRNRAERKLAAAARRAGRHLPAYLPPVFYLTDPLRTPDPAATIANLPAGWGVIYRHFGDVNRMEEAGRIARACRDGGQVLLVANDPALAMAVGADGVHWPFKARGGARHWQTRFPLMTASAHSPRQLQQLQDAAIDAGLLSTAFPSASASAGQAMGAVRFRQLANRSPLPLYALGGVNASTAGKIARAAGVAAIEGLEEVYRPRT